MTDPELVQTNTAPVTPCARWASLFLLFSFCSGYIL